MQYLTDYKKLLRSFIDGEMSAAEFRELFLQRFKTEDVPLPEEIFKTLDKMFGDADCFTEDDELLNSRPEFYVTADQLRVLAQESLEDLCRMPR